MMVLAGGDLVLPDRVQPGGSVVLDGGQIAAIESKRAEPQGATVIDVSGFYVVPGFIDVHVHGIEGHDTLDGGGAIAAIASRLPRYGVTAFCPTTIACTPPELRAFLDQVRMARLAPRRGSARVLPAHLESNFINPEYCGAQPASCLRLPPGPDDVQRSYLAQSEYSGVQILAAIAMSREDVGIVTLAPELPGALELVRSLVGAGHRVSLGHSGADFDTAMQAIAAGASHATHLFNRMSPVSHRAPGLAGAVLAHEAITPELICDGFHVHPAMCGVAIASKTPRNVMAITDATAGAGMAAGSEARLGGRTIRVRDDAAFLDDGTLAGSTLTMDRAFRNIVKLFGRSVVDAAAMCSTVPARQMGLDDAGMLVEGAAADVVVLDREMRVLRTFLDGEQVWPALSAAAQRDTR
jgi:N-acetylglucosamine-6-phosphate deacetylase